MKAAYALENGAFLEGSYTLKGIITKIDSPFNPSYGNVSVLIVVDGLEEYPILCYRLSGEGADKIGVGDTVVVTGSIKNYNGTIEFDQGCTLDSWADTGADEKPLEDQKEIVKAAYALPVGDSLPFIYTLTGVVTEIETPYDEEFGSVSVIIVVEDLYDMPILCYRLKGDGASELDVGYTVTVTGTIKNYNGTVEFNSGATLDSYSK